jgi:hypothetical protein
MTNAQRSTSTNNATSPAAAAWRIAVSNYEAAHAQFEQNWAAYEAAEAACANSDVGKRKAELGAAYGLSQSMPFETAAAKVAERGGEAEAIAGEYLGCCAALSIVAHRERVGELRQAHFDFAHEGFEPARDTLFATPAPDIAALLFKAEVLAKTVDEAEGLRDDLQRLLGGK